ncbi:MAG: glycoside hydrolase family 2, partial [Bacteroidales bacterium]|nr:glycoside hydrolase family 2 [Bacteroidales bacterium]
AGKSRTESTVEVPGPWNVRFQEGREAPAEAEFAELASYTDSPDPGIKYFSGCAVYSNSFTIDSVKEQARVMLDLGTVREIAVVKVNGTDFGTIWKEPYSVDITDAVKPGRNELEITVVNPWINRLIGDAQPDCKAPVTYTSYKFFDTSSQLHPAGLIGPVAVRTEVVE